jgi:sulfide:quinone oxidoreductase
MEDRKLTDKLAVSAQTRREDIPEIRRGGYRAILRNRPDGEADDQQSFDYVTAAARAERLEVHFMPVTYSDIRLGRVATWTAGRTPACGGAMRSTRNMSAYGPSNDRIPP